MRTAKIDQDRLIIQQHVESSKHALEMTALMKRQEELEALVQRLQADSEAGLKSDQDKVAVSNDLPSNCRSYYLACMLVLK